MNSNGDIRYLLAGEFPRADEIRLTEMEAQRLAALTREQRAAMWPEKTVVEEVPTMEAFKAMPVELPEGASCRQVGRAEHRREHGRSRFAETLAASGRS